MLMTGIFLMIPLVSYASETEKKPIRVAYFDLGGYYQKNADGTVYSYDAAYLDMVSQYTGYKFVYVDCGTWDRGLQMLEDHQVDLVGTMQWTQEREDRYEICDANYGYTVAELAAVGDSPLIYEDYEAMDGATVGYMEGYVIRDKLQALMKEKNIHFILKGYKLQSELDQALESGKIDLLAANAHAIRPNWKVIEKFAYAPFYFASWKGNEKLTEDISQAIIRINIHQADFDDELNRAYFPIMINSPYNREEMDCINENKTYTIYFDPNARPLVWYDEDEKEMKGVLVDVCEQLEKTTGLRFDILPKTQENISNEAAGSQLMTYRTLYYLEGKDASVETGVTSSILDQSFELYHRIGEDYQNGGSYSVAMVKDRDGLQDYMQREYPNCRLVEFDTPEECLIQVAQGKVDLAFVNTHIADNFMIADNLNKLTDIPMTEETFGIALQFYGEDAEVLSEIVDKGVKLIDSDTVNEAMLRYAINITPKMSLTYLFQEHLNLVIGCAIAFMLVLIFCVSLVIYAQLMKKERNRMEEINRERTDFFARMSHDMRTPMNGIMGMLELTERTSDLKEIRNNTEKAKLSGQYMLSLINDTLDLQRLESKKLTLEPQMVYVKDFIDNIIEMVTPSAQQKNIHLELKKKNIDEEFYIKIDQVRVKQIFVNILSNSVKFTPDNGTIEVHIEALEKKDHLAQVKIMISDTGIGMTKDFVENSLFKPYSQEHNKVTNRYAGSGLGLAIVKNLVDLMQGSIDVKSEEGEGTTFNICLTLPYVEHAIAQEDKKLKNSNMEEIKLHLKGKHVLICEDHPLNAEIAQRLLEAVGCETTIAQDGKQGVTFFASSPQGTFDAILMDIRMPVMDGLEAAETIRAQDRDDAKTIPIIAMTANAYDTDKENSHKAGMNAHLAKPIDVNELYRTLEEYML